MRLNLRTSFKNTDVNKIFTGFFSMCVSGYDEIKKNEIGAIVN